MQQKHAYSDTQQRPCALRRFGHWWRAALVLMVAGCSEVDPAVTGAEGIDVSHFQGTVNWQQVKAAGNAFAYMKVSEGMTVTDSELANNWPGSGAAGLLRGGYHTFTLGDDGIKQAQNFIDSLNGVKADLLGALPPALDIEPLGKANLQEASSEILAWLTAVEAASGCRPIIYTNPDSWDETLKDQFEGYKLWLADYSSTPTLPDGWTSWLFWQYSSGGTVAGIDGDTDLDRFSGDTVDLELSVCVGW